MDEKMFCFQCEQAANGCACMGNAGVCGKSAETADALDALTGALIGFAELLVELGQPIQPPQALLLLEGLFTTITNVNFDPETVRQLTEKVWEAKNAAFATACPAPAPVGDYDMKQLWQAPDEDIRSLKSTVLFGLRGMLARHARGVGGLWRHLFRLQQRTAGQREDGQQGQPSRNRPESDRIDFIYKLI